MKSPNRRYKDSVFVDLFNSDKMAKANFLSLYNALHGTDYRSTTILKNIRLKQVLYMTFYNDVSYLVDNTVIVLAEHQSTINPNLPLRCLEYMTRLYEYLQNPRDRYSRILKKIPTPEFYVFYNGKENLLAKQVLKLSDAFITQMKTPNLELVVQLININYDKRNSVVQRCKTLEQYSRFVDTVRRHIVIDKEHGFEKAIKECIQNDILKEYLQRKSREVINMLIGEYDYDTDIAVQRQESLMIGIRQGIERGSRQKALETARLMKQYAYPVPEICLITGLTVQEVEKIN